MRKARSDAVLKGLPAARQEAVAEFARDHSLAATLAWLRADGVRTSSGALSEFLSWYSLRRRFSAFEANSLTMIELLREKRPELPESELQGYAAEFFQLQALEQDDPAMFLKFATARFKARVESERLGIEREKLELAREKHQRETCELFVAWAADERAREVAASGLGHGEKIEALGRLMFGEDWDPKEGGE